MEQILQEWVDWYHENLAKGCTHEQLLPIIKEKTRRDDYVDLIINQRSLRFQETLDHFWKRAQQFVHLNKVDVESQTVPIVCKKISAGIYYFRHFLSQEECSALIAAISDKMRPSTTINRLTGQHQLDPERKSQGAFFARGSLPLIQQIERRLSLLSGVPEDHGEDIQVVYYPVGGEYVPHFDSFDPELAGTARHLANGGQRFLTLILYLNTVTRGGGTVFPEHSLELIPEVGSLLMFPSVRPDGSIDRQSLHGGRPVLEGEKWILTKWFHLGRYYV
jgi:prolyl 4-hydroxylase